jgi:hypothetical protein
MDFPSSTRKVPRQIRQRCSVLPSAPVAWSAENTRLGRPPAGYSDEGRRDVGIDRPQFIAWAGRCRPDASPQLIVDAENDPCELKAGADGFNGGRAAKALASGRLASAWQTVDPWWGGWVPLKPAIHRRMREIGERISIFNLVPTNSRVVRRTSPHFIGSASFHSNTILESDPLYLQGSSLKAQEPIADRSPLVASRM